MNSIVDSIIDKNETCYCGSHWQSNGCCTNGHTRPICKMDKNKFHSDSCKNCVSKEFGHSYGIVRAFDGRWIYPI